MHKQEYTGKMGQFDLDNDTQGLGFTGIFLHTSRQSSRHQSAFFIDLIKHKNEQIASNKYRKLHFNNV